MLWLAVEEKPALAFSTSESTLLPLKSLVLSADELDSEFGSFSDVFTVSYDATNELENFCFNDCAKTVWSSPTGDKLTITMIRLANSEDAQKSIQNLWQIFQSLGNIFYPSDKLTEEDNSWSGVALYSKDKFQYVACKTQGPVLVFISYHKFLRYFMADVDSGEYISRVELTASAQQQKLKTAGYSP